MITDFTPLNERAAAPEARRITSAGHSSRAAPSPTASTLPTGSDGTCNRVSCSAPALAPSARNATSISPMDSASRNGPPTTDGASSSPGPLTTGTSRTDEPAPRLGRLVATVTVGAV